MNGQLKLLLLSIVVVIDATKANVQNDVQVVEALFGIRNEQMAVRQIVRRKNTNRHSTTVTELDTNAT